MKYTIQIGFLLIFMLNHSWVRCQQNINVAGHSASINNMQFQYSIGEMVLTTTERSTDIIVTQGLLQPFQGSKDLQDGINGNQTNQGNSIDAAGDRIKVYPNPTQSVLNVESIENAEAEINYQLFDAMGKVILSEKVIWQAGTNKISLDLKNFAAGSYYLMIRKPNAHGVLENFSYKIQKTN